MRHAELLRDFETALLAVVNDALAFSTLEGGGLVPVRFDRAIQDELALLIGRTVVADIMVKLSADLSQRFGTDPVDAEGRELLRQDAHAVTSSAGMLGFRVLSSACAALETMIQDALLDLTDRLRIVRAERDWALRHIATADASPIIEAEPAVAPVQAMVG